MQGNINNQGKVALVILLRKSSFSHIWIPLFTLPFPACVEVQHSGAVSAICCILHSSLQAETVWPDMNADCADRPVSRCELTSHVQNPEVHNSCTGRTLKRIFVTTFSVYAFWHILAHRVDSCGSLRLSANYQCIQFILLFAYFRINLFYTLDLLWDSR